MGAGICGPSRTTPGTVETNEPPLPHKGDQNAGCSDKHDKERQYILSKESSPQPVNGQLDEPAVTTPVNDSNKITNHQSPTMKEDSRPCSKESGKSRRSGVVQPAPRPTSREHVQRQSRINSLDNETITSAHVRNERNSTNGNVDLSIDPIKDVSSADKSKSISRDTGVGDDVANGELSRTGSSIDRELGIVNYSSVGSDGSDDSEMAWSADEESLDIPEFGARGKLREAFNHQNIISFW